MAGTIIQHEGETPDSLRPLSHALSSPIMSQSQILGTCPHCGSELSPHDTLIEYERSGKSTQYVECPDCEAVVRPQ